MPPEVVEALNVQTPKSLSSSHVVQHYSVLPHLKKDSERLKTFLEWNVSFLDPKKLVEGGFYYTSREDIVRCAFCGVEMGCWEEGDDPIREHKRVMGSKCPFLMGTKEEAVHHDEEEEKSQDVCGPYDLTITPEERVKAQSSDIWRELENLMLWGVNKPVAPHLATYSSRLKTFENWPIPEVQSPEKLAEAGFYYTSVDDNVLCFHCGGGMNSWEVGDDPWVDHAREFSRCGYITTQKGREFVEKVLRSTEQTVSAVAVEGREDKNWRCNDTTKEDTDKENETILPISNRSKSKDERHSHDSSVSLMKDCVLCDISRIVRQKIQILLERIGVGWNLTFSNLKRLLMGNIEKEGEKHRNDLNEEHRQLAAGRCAVMGHEGKDTARVHNACRPHGLEIRPFSAPERLSKISPNPESSEVWRELQDLVLSRINKPVAPHLATYSSRLKTFENWPIPEVQSPEKLAEAGFYYTSVDDNVLCFHCGGGMNSWEVGDDPWVDHAREFSRCGYITTQKRRECVKEVLRSTEQTVSAMAIEEGSERSSSTKEESEAMPPTLSSSKEERKSVKCSDSEIKDIELCRICYARKRVIVFLPCGHFVCCTECAPALGACAVCQNPFEAVVRASLT